MSFLKQLLEPFVEFDEKAKPKEAPKQKVPPSAPAPSPSTVSPAPPPRTPSVPQNRPENTAPTHPLVHPSEEEHEEIIPRYSPAGTIAEPLPEHIQYFENLISEANQNNPLFRGADYKEFIDSKVDIDDIDDESAKYRTALSVLKSSGLTKEKLIDTAHEYVQLIGRDLNKFQGAHSLQFRKDVGQKEQLMRKKAEELQALQRRVQQLKSEINTLAQEIDLVRQKMDPVRQSFLLAGERKQNEILTEIENFRKYF